jgi:Domain of unknown function (DUF4359)
MKRWQIVFLGTIGLCGLGLTNPDRSAYETYAVDRIADLAIDRCNQVDGFGVVLQGPCRAAIAAYKSQLLPILAATTTRQNWGLFSIYRSDIAIPTVNFNVRVESIGIFNNFFTYKTSLN